MAWYHGIRTALESDCAAGLHSGPLCLLHLEFLSSDGHSCRNGREVGIRNDRHGSLVREKESNLPSLFVRPTSHSRMHGVILGHNSLPANNPSYALGQRRATSSLLACARVQPE